MAKEYSGVKLDVTFTAASTRENIISAENIALSFGKLAKWYTDFAWSAWTAPTVEVTGTGNAITTASYGTGTNANKLTLTKGTTFLTSDTQFIKAITSSGSGGAVTGMSVSSGTLTYTLGNPHPTIPTQTDETSTASPAFGGTFTAVDSVTRDSNGHVLKINTKTVTVPNTTMGAASADAAGTIGLVPAPAAGKQSSFLRGDGTWVVPTNTDTKVTQNVSSADKNYPVLLSYYENTDDTTTAQTVNRVNTIYANPNSGYLWTKALQSPTWGITPTSSAPSSASFTLSDIGLYFRSRYLSEDGNAYDYSRPVLRTYKGKHDNNGMVVSLDSGGLTIVGGGESATSLAGLISEDQHSTSTTPTRLDVGGTLNTAFTGSAEHLILSADNNIYFITKCNTIAQRQPVVLDMSLYFYPGTTNTGSIGTSSYKWGNGYFTTINIGTANITTGNITTLNATKSNGIAKVGYVAFPEDGTLLYNEGGSSVTGAIVITTPFSKTVHSVMLKFTVDIYDYQSNKSIEYKVSGYAYNDGKWYCVTAHNVAAPLYGQQGTDSSETGYEDLAVRFGYVTNGNYQIQIGETTTVWKWPNIVIRDILVGHVRATEADIPNVKSGWNIAIQSSGDIANVTQTISHTRPYYPTTTVSGSVDADTYLKYDGIVRWNTTTGTNMPTNNYGLLICKAGPAVQVFIPDNASGMYFRRKASTSGATPTAWWGFTGTAGNTYNLDNFITSYTDEKVKITTLAASTAAATYMPTFVAAAGTSGVNVMSAIKYGHNPGTTSAVGNSRLILGNATAEGSANNEQGLLRIYSAGTAYHTLYGMKTNTNIEHALPTVGGTLINSGCVGTGLTWDSTNNALKHSNSVTAVSTAALLKVKYDAQGHITGSSAATSSDLPAHTHYEQDVKFDTSYNYRPIDGTGFPLVPQCLINTMRTNRFAFLPASSITVQHSTDSGSNYTDSGYSDEAKCSTFISRHTGQIKVGPNTSAERTTSMRTMVTITRDSRYTRINRFYIWFSTSGHTVYVDIQYATNAADTTWVDWRTNILLAGWSGPNLINGPTIAFGANNDHAKKIRFIFRYTSIRSDYKTQPSQVYEIAAYSDHATWTPANNLMMNDHLYYWNYQQQAFFPAEIKVPTQLRIHNGNYGALFRTDGTNTHILFTDSGSALNGSYNSLRPFSISNSSGLITMGEGLKINTKDGAFLEIHGVTSSSYAYGSSSPKIRFTNASNDQNADLIWDDHDTYCTPASLTLIGNQDGTFFCAPRIRLFSAPTAGSLIDIDDTNNKNFHLRYKSSLYGYANIISVYPGPDQYGVGVIFNNTGGGLCIIGGGESAASLNQTVRDASTSPYGTAWTYGTENMVIGADTSIYFVSGANSLTTTNHTDWTHLKTALFDNNGYFRPSVDNKGQIGASNYRWNYGYFDTVDANTVNITNSAFGPLTITRSSAYGAGIVFKNSNGSLGSIGMTGTADGGLLRWSASGATTYTVCDTGNTSVTQVLSSGTKIATIKIAGTGTDLYCEKNTDEKVTQSTTNVASYKPIVLGYTETTTVSDLDATVTNQVYVTTKLYTQPSSGTLYMDGKCFIGTSTQSSYPTGGIHVHDVRNVTVTPDMAAGKSANFYFHQYTLDGTNNYWWGVLNVRPWDGGYSSWEIAGPSHNVDQRTTPLYVRTSNKNTAWGNWRKIYDTANKPTAADVGAVPNTKAGMNAAIDLLDTGADSVEMTDSMTFISHDSNASTVAYLKRSNLVMYNYIYKKLQHNNAMDVSHTFAAWNTVGWHRCFSMPCSATASGRIIRTLEITVYRNYNNGQPEYFKVRLAGLYNATESFDVLYQKSNTAATQYITKIRMVKSADSKTLYIDLYYNSTNSNANTMYVKWYDPDNSLNGSEKITWSTDTVAQAVQDDSLTVVATLDIPWTAGDGYYKGSTGHWGVMFPGGSTAGWLRTSASGLLPNTTAGLTRTTGSSLGASGWAFLYGYIKSIHSVNLNVYNSAATYKHEISSIASANRTITLPDTNCTVGTGLFYVLGTQNAKTKMWTGNLPIPQLYDGLTIAFYLPYDVVTSQNSTVWDASSNTNVWLQLTLSNGQTTDWVPCYWTNQSRLTTHFSAGATILLTYWSAPKINGLNAAAPVSKQEGGQTVYWPSIARWTRSDYNSNSDTKVNVTLGKTTKAYLLGTSTTPTSTAAAVTTIADTGVYLDTTAGMITATTFNGAATKLSTDAGTEVDPVYFTNGVPTVCKKPNVSVSGHSYASSTPYFKLAKTADITSAKTSYRICFLVSKRKIADSTTNASYGIMCVHFESSTSNGTFGYGSVKWLAVENGLDTSSISVKYTTGTNKFSVAIWAKLSSTDDLIIMRSIDNLGFSYESNTAVWSFISNATAAASASGTEIPVTISLLQNTIGGGQSLLYNGSVNLGSTSTSSPAQLTISGDYPLAYYQALLIEFWSPGSGNSNRIVVPLRYVRSQTAGTIVWFQLLPTAQSSDATSTNHNNCIGISSNSGGSSYTKKVLVVSGGNITGTWLIRVYSLS